MKNFMMIMIKKIYDYNWIHLLNNALSTANNLYIGNGCLHFINKSDINIYYSNINQPLMSKVEFLIKISKYSSTPLDIDIKNALIFDNLDSIKDPDLCTEISKMYIDEKKYKKAFDILTPALSENRFYPAITLQAHMYKNCWGV